jgi:putative endonuclease
MYSYVYMIECVNGSYYTGWTNDPVRRMNAHLSGRGAKYTRAHPPVRMVASGALPHPQPGAAPGG